MEVTRQNFKEALPIISQAIEDASFLAIDTEFSGVTLWKTENALDTCEERYRKLVNGVKDFTILQFGLCTFGWDEEQQQYVARPFNFYIFPKPYNRQMPDMRFLCQSSSLDFLASQGFNFNKWIYHGIPFLSPQNEEKLRRLLESRRQEDERESGVTNGTASTPKQGAKTKQNATIPPQYEKTIQNVMKKVADFRNDPDEKSLSLPPSSPLVRKLVYNSVNSTYKSGLHLESKLNDRDKKFIMITKVSDEEKKVLESEKYDRENEEVEAAVGFSKVVRLIAQSGKVILGHNMLLDLLHMIRLFVCPQLPHNLDDFKALVKSVFPRLVDTKLMASTKPLQDHFTLTHLEEVYKRTSEKPFEKPDVLLPEGFEDYIETAKAHEAGFDAYLTGVSYLGMAAYLEKQRDGDIPKSELDFKITKPFVNKIFLFPRIEDVPYLNLDGKDIFPNRNHVFYIQHPDTWQFSDIRALFEDFGYVYITRQNNTSAFVSLAKKERAANVLDKLDIDDVPYKIMSYAKFHRADDEDDKDGLDDTYSLNSTHDSPHAQTSSSPSPKLDTSAVLLEGAMPSDGEMEEGEIPDSPEPPRKKLKNEHGMFEEPDEW